MSEPLFKYYTRLCVAQTWLQNTVCIATLNSQMRTSCLSGPTPKNAIRITSANLVEQRNCETSEKYTKGPFMKGLVVSVRGPDVIGRIRGLCKSIISIATQKMIMLDLPHTIINCFVYQMKSYMQTINCSVQTIIGLSASSALNMETPKRKAIEQKAVVGKAATKSRSGL